MADKVWVLTSSYNDYDQHGEYFCCVWKTKPTTEQLVQYFKYTENNTYDVMQALEFILHVQNGGGRRGTENQWYLLKEVPFGKNCEED